MEEGKVDGKMFVTSHCAPELVNPSDDRFDLPTPLEASQFPIIFDYHLLVFPVWTTRCRREVTRLSTSRSRARNHYRAANFETLLTALPVCGLIASCNGIYPSNSALPRVRRHPARYPVVAVVDSRAFTFPNDIVLRAASRYCVPEPRYLGRGSRPVPQPSRKMPCGSPFAVSTERIPSKCDSASEDILAHL